MLAEYGDNIDAAIKHLTDLRLSAAAAAASASAPADAEQQQQQAVAGADQQQQLELDQQQRQQKLGGGSSGGILASAAAAAAAAAETEGGPASTTAAPGAVKTAAEWVDVVVSEMAAATDMGDARARASRVLQAFEQAALEHGQVRVRALQWDEAAGRGSAV